MTNGSLNPHGNHHDDCPWKCFIFSDPVINGTIVVNFFRCGSATVTSKPGAVKEITTDATKPDDPKEITIETTKPERNNEITAVITKAEKKKNYCSKTEKIKLRNIFAIYLST
jgi:hypothetical protein